jgi:hypothetical protein
VDNFFSFITGQIPSGSHRLRAKLRLRFGFGGRSSFRRRVLVVASLLPTSGRAIPKLGELLVESLDRVGPLPEKVFDERLLAALDRLFFLKEFLNRVGRLFFRHR